MSDKIKPLPALAATLFTAGLWGLLAGAMFDQPLSMIVATIGGWVIGAMIGGWVSET